MFNFEGHNNSEHISRGQSHFNKIKLGGQQTRCNYHLTIKMPAPLTKNSEQLPRNTHAWMLRQIPPLKPLVLVGGPSLERRSNPSQKSGAFIDVASLPASPVTTVPVFAVEPLERSNSTTAATSPTRPNHLWRRRRALTWAGTVARFGRWRHSERFLCLFEGLDQAAGVG